MTSNIDRATPLDPGALAGSEARFWAKVDRSAGPDGCWLWTAHTVSIGYGHFKLGATMVLAHRVAWVLDGRVLHRGMVLDHTCETPACVNPHHLVEVTQRQNVRSCGMNRRNTSGFRGVSWDKRERRWKASVKTAEGGRSGFVWLGYHPSREAAARAVAMWWWVHEPGARNVGIELLSEADKLAAVDRWGGEVA